MPSKDAPTRAVIYARYSSENQREASIEDQVELCRRYVERQGWTLVRVYDDAAISGSDRRRPGYRLMLADAQAGSFDVIVCEALDRLSRRLSDVASLHDQLQFAGLKIHALNIGEAGTMHIGLLGTMAQLFLSDLREKTRRGQMGRVMAGRIPAGNAYGYDMVAGTTGERQVNETEAAVVRRIFSDYAAGYSPRAIAKKLNAEGIPGPAGRLWGDTSIRGHPTRGSGILNNVLYVGRIEWNRCSYVTNPGTGKKVARLNPREEWEIASVPHMRIVDDALWGAVKQRQGEQSQAYAYASSNSLNQTHQKRFLLSGLLKCGLCGGAYTIVGRDRYGCATRRSKGTCGNSATVNRQALETRVLGGLKEKLMAPELIEEFITAYRDEFNRAQSDKAQSAKAGQQRLKTVDKKIQGILAAIEDGNYSRALGERLAALEQERDALEEGLQSEPEPVIYLHPKLADIYAEKVKGLLEALNDPEIRTEATGILRSLIARIEVYPKPEGRGIDAMLFGELAEILNLCASPPKNKPSGGKASEGQLSVVAGA